MRGERELVARKLRPERLEQRLGQERVAHDPAVDDEVDVVPVASARARGAQRPR